MYKPLFQHVGIIGKYAGAQVTNTIARTIAVIRKLGLRLSLDKDTMPSEYQSFPETYSKKDWQQIDLCIVIGGDGTFLHAGRAVLERQIPLLGVHTGRLGFLTDLTPADLEEPLEKILAGEFRHEERATLAIEIYQGEKKTLYHAINDVVFHSMKAKMIELDVHLRLRHLSHYRADGLIIATPTGSTAYALSAGGPIIEPNLPVSLIVPICPHTLTQRPVVVDSKSPLTITTNGQQVQLSIDGHEQLRLHKKDKVVITAGQTLPVLHPADYHFQDRLRAKFNWGVAPEDNHG